jgi:hypothetical protein
LSASGDVSVLHVVDKARDGCGKVAGFQKRRMTLPGDGHCFQCRMPPREVPMNAASPLPSDEAPARQEAA